MWGRGIKMSRFTFNRKR